ncbi:hypothetical protein [Streptomyces shenzhenensis]|uniref:hypothetical protein n=1 Tax=Streptomyces shenzhenensis TaxID=943815 RepID=UPI0033E84434
MSETATFRWSAGSWRGRHRAGGAPLLERPRPAGEIVEVCGLRRPSTSRHRKVRREPATPKG